MKIKHTVNLLSSCALVCLMAMCTPAKVPTDAKTVMAQANIYPDYDGVTIPANIAPLNFEALDSAKEYVAHAHLKGQQGVVAKGNPVQFDQKKWKKMLNGASVGDTLLIDLYAKRGGEWQRHPSLKVAVAEPIDPYVSYRLIEPSYIGFETIRICQRNLENFEEDEIFNNRKMAEDVNGQCINCHSYQDYNRTGNMQMHVRINHGGTVIAHDGKVYKINLKTDSTISAGVYPSWHPELPLIAYSNNLTTQNFHSRNTNKVEVQDGASDIVLYDVENNKLSIIANEDTEFETFPYWSADGNWLYYVSAKVPYMADPDSISMYKAQNYRDFKYNIYRKPFDRQSLTFGPTDTVFMASDYGCSAIHPRESRDGKFLVFALAPYGTFHIWHKDADLYIMDLETKEVRPMREINSDDVESYHSFSSNGRWMVFSSRRDDGSFTRLYITHFDENGNATKPFLLPQENPRQNQLRYKSYNIPEFMACPVSVTQQQLMDAVGSEAIQVEL